MTTVLDIEKLPEYWDKVAEEKEAEARTAQGLAKAARATAFMLRAERGESTPAATPTRRAGNRREAAHRRLLGLDPYGSTDEGVRAIHAQAQQNFADALAGKPATN